uniref:DUF676 domain-containing protein n=1 Tax=Spongospora subterranea TaxID=70186 RepID=A0A0H5QN84_9EUKA|eukprot:CRZ03011.1 hypothetical protein [Spongospora subterranea]
MNLHFPVCVNLEPVEFLFQDGKPEEELCCEKAAWRIRRELWTLSSRVFSLWNSLVDLLPNIFRVLVTKLWDGFITNNYERFGSCIFRQTFEYSNRFCSLDRQTVKTRQRICNAVRSSQSIGVLGRGPIEDMTLISNVMDHAVMFEERFLQKVVPPTHGDNLSPRESRVRDVIIFVHGYQGSSGDLRLFKNTLLMKTSGLLTLLSTSNEMDTECSIHDMGVRLALEIQSFVMTGKYFESHWQAFGSC